MKPHTVGGKEQSLKNIFPVRAFHLPHSLLLLSRIPQATHTIIYLPMTPLTDIWNVSLLLNHAAVNILVLRVFVGFGPRSVELSLRACLLKILTDTAKLPSK